MLEMIRSKFPNLILEAVTNRGDQVIVIKKEEIKNIAATLKSDPAFGFSILMDLTAVDYLHWPEKECRFEVVYNLFSISKNQRLFIKAAVKETEPEIDSVASIWPAANWYEREVWDMFGVRFNGHPGLKRILMYEEFQGHALRKDYPYNKRQPLIGPVN